MNSGAVQIFPIQSTFLTTPALLDFRFFWNRLLHVPFVRHGVDVDRWLFRVTCGSVDIKTVYVGSRQAKAAVISRLSSERAGTRFEST